ncbi:Os02g0744682, partial [Oryza sativa Japonica Group]
MPPQLIPCYLLLVVHGDLDKNHGEGRPASLIVVLHDDGIAPVQPRRPPAEQLHHRADHPEEHLLREHDHRHDHARHHRASKQRHQQ